MKPQDLIPGGIYAHQLDSMDSEWIFIFQSHDGRYINGTHCININPYSSYYDHTYSNPDHGHLREATSEERLWLLTSIQHGKKVEKPEIKLETYEVC